MDVLHRRILSDMRTSPPCHEMCDRCADLYNLHIHSVKCFALECPEAGLQPCAGKETKLGCLTHMKQRVNDAKVFVDQPAADLVGPEMPPLYQPLHLLLSGR